MLLDYNFILNSIELESFNIMGIGNRLFKKT